MWKILKYALCLAGCTLALFACGQANNGGGEQQVVPVTPPEDKPEESKLPRAGEQLSSRYTAAGDAVFQDVWSEGTYELHSLMVVKNGEVVYESWANGHSPEELHILWSVSKTFTALAVGFAVEDGLLEVNNPVKQYFTAAELPEKDSVWGNKMSVYDLLTMSSGLQGDYLGEAVGGHDFDWAARTLRSGIMFAPGSKFHYNSMNSYLLSVIVSRLTNKKMSDYLDEKLFAPLGIEDYIWEESPQGYNSGGWGLYLSTESLAKVGQMMLNGGEWEGKRIIGERWVDAMTSPQIMQYKGVVFDPVQIEQILASRDQNQKGYGYQMWCCNDGAVRMDGAWSQFVIIFPKQKAVVVTTAHSGNNAGVLNSVWNRLYPLL